MQPIIRAAALFSLLGLLFSGAEAAADDSAADNHRRLLTGEVLTASINTGGPIKAGRAWGIVDAPAQTVFKIISDIHHYRHFVPRMMDSKKLGEGRYALKSNMPWPANDVWAHVTAKAGKRDGVYVVVWKMDKGSFSHFDGVAWIQPFGKDRCLLTYQLLALPETLGAVVPDNILQRGMRGVSEAMVEAVRVRAKDVVSGRAVTGDRVAEK